MYEWLDVRKGQIYCLMDGHTYVLMDGWVVGCTDGWISLKLLSRFKYFSYSETDGEYNPEN